MAEPLPAQPAPTPSAPAPPTPGADLTRWAAACAEHALTQFAVTHPGAAAAITAARAWADGSGTPDACRDAAFEAQLAARELQGQGYRAAATCVRAAGYAAASADATTTAEAATLARTAADYAIEALAGNSAPCEQQFNTETERRWQWTQLPADHRPLVFEAEPASPAPAACAIDPT